MDCCSSAASLCRGLSVAVMLTIGILVVAGCADLGSDVGRMATATANEPCAA